ncbi:MAG TPA: 3'-5' exonuclease, partial [Gammaproteobacteria bacterium]|nr:3'-5' exonuclease [Gammaproteobacteria bacterium]
VDTNLGFEAGGHKTRLTQVLSELNAQDELLELFARARALPAPDFEAVQWQALEALLAVLPFCAAQLQVLFSERGEVDYAEVALRALTALGTDVAPTDLALALDMRIRHLLVDEFQDTSFNQFTLLERLTAGWQSGDGRSLFLVGDPMQSIYRFREAEVSLFLRAQQQGIGGVQLEPLTLNRNFRSQPGIVNWVNAGFSRVFAARSDLLSGAVSYSPSIAASGLAKSADAVAVHVSFSRDAEREAADMLAVIRAARTRGQGVAVLVRGRQHLLALMPVLRRAALPFRAVELEKLVRRPVVQDLLALTRALLHPADRSAWLAVLRAPWCGLKLADLQVLCEDNAGATLPVLLQDETRRTALDADAQRRLARVTEILLDAGHLRRGSLREQVEQAWMRLAGPATCMTESDTVDAEAYLALLETLDEGGMLAEPGALLEALEELYALPDPQADDGLQLMTIHKAKGLEFDVVIVPALGAKPRNRTRPLLAHLERIRGEHDPDLLLSPLNARGSDQDPLYELVHALRGEQEAFENQRLMYVAATRARHQLHLFGHTGYSEKDGQRSLRAPAARSLLATLWPALQSDFRAALDADPVSQPHAPESAAGVSRRLRRLPVDWQPPAPAADLGGAEAETLAATPDNVLEFEWAGDTLRHVGSVVHRVLQRISEDVPTAWSAERLRGRATLLRGWLHEAGVPQQELDGALASVLDAVTRMLADPDGRRILMARGPEARSEYALSCRDGGRLLTGVIDRTFVDNDGTRWIVDYKTSRHEGADLDAFLAREAERYRVQLAGYARLMRLREQRPIRAGLYFPLLGRFHAVDVT